MSARLPTLERQPEIVAAALFLARETSPALITTTDIAAAVGVTQGALFKHFPTKDAIWLAAMSWVREQLLASLEQASAAAPPLAGLRAMFGAHVDFILENPGVPRLIFHELQRPSDSPIKQEVRALLKSYRKLVRDRLEDGVARGEFLGTLDLEAAVTLFIGMVQGLVMQSMAAGSHAIVKTRANAVFSLYCRCIERDV